LNKLYIRFARNARGSGAQRSDAPTALSVKPELPAAFLPTAHSYLWPEGVNRVTRLCQKAAPLNLAGPLNKLIKKELRTV